MNLATVHCGSFGEGFDFSEAALGRALAELPDVSFREPVLRYRRPRHRWMSLLSRRLLLAPPAPTAIAGASWATDADGRPYLRGCGDFNISHSGKMAVCAFSNGTSRVGIDVQNELPIGERQQRQVFTRREIAWVQGHPRRAAFIWSRKEAVAKLIGLGMRLDFRKLEALQQEITYAGQTYFLGTVPVPRGYQCSVAGETPLTVRTRYYRWDSLSQLIALPSPSAHSAS